ncbi:hypothetical protein GCM10023192_32930 [Amycolatopsis samaneae]
MDSKGYTAHWVLVTRASEIAEEYYGSFLLARSQRAFPAMASAEVVATRLAVVLGDPEVRGVLVNVFGGITACAAVTSGILRAPGILGETATKPLIVRLDGNNVAAGRRLLAAAAHPLLTVVGMVDDAAVPATAHTERSGTVAIFPGKSSRIMVSEVTGAEATPAHRPHARHRQHRHRRHGGNG